jgi:hypothetical protein
MMGHTIGRFGEKSFRRMGTSPEDTDYENHLHEFPFDRVITTNDYDSLDLINVFSQYLGEEQAGQYLQHCKSLNRPITYVVWHGYLWIQPPQQMGPASTDVISKKTKTALESLTFEILRQLLPAQFQDRTIKEILFRRDQILAANLRVI